MKSFAEFLSHRDPEMLVEFVQYAENIINEAEETAKKTWWRSLADRSKQYLLPTVAGLGLAQGFAGAAQAGDTGTQEAPTSQIGGEGGNLIKAWNPETKSYEMVPASETNKDPFTGVTFVKPKPKAAAKDPLMDFVDEPPDGTPNNPAKPAQTAEDLTPKFAKYVYHIQAGTLDPKELDSILKGTNEIYNAAKKLAYQQGGSKNPAYDSASKFVIAVEKLKEEGRHIQAGQLGQKFANWWASKVFGGKPK